MKKLSIIFGIIILMTACNKDKEKKNNTENKQATEKEAVSREADHSKTKFVLFQSDYDPKTTYQKMKSYLEEKGMFYPRIVDHQTAAHNAQMELNEVYLMIFGNPKMGTLLMQENPEVGIELPLKALIYKDNEGRTWVMYKDMNYLKDLYFIKDPNDVIKKMNNLQAGFKQAVYNPIKTTQIKDEEIQ
jgi:beta-galactosidase